MVHTAGIHHAVTVYGNGWCGDTQRTLALLKAREVEFNYYDIDKDPAMARTAAALQNGASKTPVVVLGEGIVLIEPTDDALVKGLYDSGHLA